MLEKRRTALTRHSLPRAARRPGGARPLREKQLPEMLDMFGWCTWDAFYSNVSARGARLAARHWAAPPLSLSLAAHPLTW